MAQDYLDSLNHYKMSSDYYKYWVTAKKVAGEDQMKFNLLMQEYREKWLKSS